MESMIRLEKVQNVRLLKKRQHSCRGWWSTGALQTWSDSKGIYLVHPRDYARLRVQSTEGFSGCRLCEREVKTTRVKSKTRVKTLRA